MNMSWPSVIGDLRVDLTVKEIADAAGVEPSTITELQAGRTAQPRHDTGEKLLALWRKKRPLAKQRARA